MSGKSWSGDKGGVARACEVSLYILAAVLLAMALSSCQTAHAVAKAPEEWWVTTEEILLAFGKDLWSIVSLLFPAL